MTPEDYYKALLAHDRRFDGVFFICVLTTKIYCRPICPTHPPLPKNCQFVATVAEAEKRGFRPCLRCRPELAPLQSVADSTPACRLARHIEETLLIDETLAGVSKSLGISERHLRRSFYEVYGVEPRQYLTTRRLLFAKQLLQDTQLPIRDVAYSAGFGSPDRLTVNMRTAYGFTPTRFRKEKSPQKSQFITLRADYRPPFDWQGLLKLLKDRATPFEIIEDEIYKRTVNGGTIVVSNEAAKNRLRIQIPMELSQGAYMIIQKVRRLFDLDANPEVISAALQLDPFMRQLAVRYPGIRVPGAWDEFELLVRVIIGQQISVAGATTVMTRLVENVGISPEALASSAIEAITAAGIPSKRAETIHEVAMLVAKNSLQLSDRDPTTFYNQLIAVPGIGAWTAEYALLRILHWPDAFPAGDLGIQKALSKGEKKISEGEARARAAAWRPWRSYATILLWRSLVNHGG